MATIQSVPAPFSPEERKGLADLYATASALEAYPGAEARRAQRECWQKLALLSEGDHSVMWEQALEEGQRFLAPSRDGDAA